MSEYFDVFFHQQAMSLTSGTVPFNEESPESFIAECEGICKRLLGDTLAQWEKEELLSQLKLPSSKKYIEIQFFQVQLDVDVLLEELRRIFPQFIWLKVVEEVDDSFNSYYCEFVPLAFDVSINSIEINLFESLKQMNVPHDQTISEIIEKSLDSILKEEEIPTEQILSYPVKVLIEEPVEPEPDTRPKKKKKKKNNNKTKEKSNSLAKTKKQSLPVEPKGSSKNKNKTNEKKVEKKVEKETGKEVLYDTDVAVRSEKSEILFLKESLKQEQNSKQRMKIVKAKLEEDLLAAENTMLKSSITQYKKINRQELTETEWYKTIRIDFVKYDEICKKANFLEKIWNLNKELVEVFNSVQDTSNLSYDQERVAKIKRKVSKTKMLTWLEQSKRIFSRAKIRPGILFIKPSVKLYKVDYEQLERMSALFDIIQAENNFLERILDDREQNQLD